VIVPLILATATWAGNCGERQNSDTTNKLMISNWKFFRLQPREKMVADMLSIAMD
jgi:hypothetical protein